MLKYFTLFAILTVLTNGIAIPGLEKRDAPAPLKLDFTVEKKVNATARFPSRFGKRGTYPEVITDTGDVSYNLNIYLGSNQQVSNVMIDTGSSDLWVTSQTYDPSSSSSSQDTGEPFSIGYADGTTENGEFYLDTLSFDPSNAPTVNNFQFALIQSNGQSQGGVLGIGNRNTESTNQEYDNLPWALADNGITPKASYSLFLGPENGQGSLIFGGIDTDKYQGQLQKYPVDTASGPGLYVNVASINVNGESFSSNQPYLLDSGTSLGFVQKNVQDYLDKVFNPTMVQEGDITYRQVSCNQPTDKYITFNFGQNTIALSYADAITNDGSGQCLLGFTEYNNYNILGDVFLRKAYVYYDLTDSTISLAQAQYSTSSNIISA